MLYDKPHGLAMDEAGCFPLASRYGASPGWDGRLRERPDGRRFRYSERHVQSVWYDQSLRPGTLVTAQGESVTVEDPGTWNLAAGPDFLGAVIRLGPDHRRFVGDVEIHIHPRDWVAHGHRDDARYRDVRFHVTYFPGSLPPGELPEGTVEISLQAPLAANPGFDFDAIDLVAYPFAERAIDPPCRGVLASWPADRKLAMLAAAGQERLAGKARRLAAHVAEQGLQQTYYEAFLVALGYRDNKAPARLLARRLPVERLQQLAEGDAIRAYALLAGMAGLLPDPASVEGDDETRRFLRGLWDEFWRLRGQLDTEPMTRESWALSGLRPLNHPARRLMAAAQSFADPESVPRLLADIARVRPDRVADAFASHLAGFAPTYWTTRASWGGKRLAAPTALLGRDRVLALFINVTVPLLAVTGNREAFAAGLLEAIPAEPMNTVIRQAGFFLFGPDMPASFIKPGLHRQGLIQIFQDYCLADRTRCAACRFPDWLRESTEPT